MRQDYTQVQNIYIVCGKTDMRKGIDGLAALIQDSFELDPYSASIFLFAGWKKTDTNVYISTVTASPCCISGWIVESCNGQEMNRK
ncbi:hypothetical protein NCCP2716_19110 [Sporosarcina sp. NCCP-2716]|nr:transposase [Sporosarcina sp. NCCP-2716]GKV69413.1 hypothetical protein NCCP2716_19110 [Sporosarcina sp. NCCP-2716]